MSVDTWIKIWKASFALTLLGTGQFLVCCVLAMLFYAGGNVEDRNAPGYSVSQNFVSDLGRTASLSGAPNTTSSRIFNGSLMLFGVCQLPWFLFMPMQAWDRPVALWIAAGIGSLAALALVFAGSNPADLRPATHHLFLFAWVVGIFLSSSIHAIAMLTSRENEFLVLPLVSVGVAMLAIAWAISATETASAFLTHRNSVPLQSVWLEKMVFIATMIWFLTFTARLLLTTDFSEYRERQTAADAEMYLNEISDQPLRR